MLQPDSEKVSMDVKNQGNEASASSFTDVPNGISLHEPSTVQSSPESPSLSSFAETANRHRQLVLYEPIQSQQRSSPNPRLVSSSRPASPSIGAFTVQCAKCFKWRIVPSKQKYEEIREHIVENPFFCETARQWRHDVSCDDPADISQDESRLWAIDKPSIARPPCGWQRLLHIRGEGSTKFADVYYVAPSGKRLRSKVDVEKFLAEHPEYTRQGVDLSQFSFKIPTPLRENYVKKRTSRGLASSDNTQNPESSGGNLTDLRLGTSCTPSSKRPRKSQPLMADLNSDYVEDPNDD